MKKKLFLAGASMLLAAAAVTGYTAYSKATVGYLLSANIEALAHAESADNAYQQRVQCLNCGQDIEVCFACAEPNCGSCWVPKHDF